MSLDHPWVSQTISVVIILVVIAILWRWGWHELRGDFERLRLARSGALDHLARTERRRLLWWPQLAAVLAALLAWAVMRWVVPRLFE